MKTTCKQIFNQNLFRSKLLIYMSAETDITVEKPTDDEAEMSIMVDQRAKLVTEINRYDYLLQKGNANKVFTDLKNTKIPDDPKEALKVLKNVNPRLSTLSKVLSEIALSRTKDEKEKGGLKTIPGTDLPELTVGEVTSLLNKQPEDALIWLTNNRERNSYLGFMRGLYSEVYGAKKPLLNPAQAKTYREMEPDKALSALKEIHKQNCKAVENRDKAKAENDLEQALNRMV